MDIQLFVWFLRTKYGGFMEQYFSTTQDSEQAPREAMPAFIYHPAKYLSQEWSWISLSGLKLS